MKLTTSLRLFLLSLATSVSAATALAATESATSLEKNTALTAFLEVLAEDASNGASIEFFGWIQNFNLENKSACQIVEASQVVKEFTQIAQRVLIEPTQFSASAVDEFESLLGTDTYRSCHESFTGGRSFTELHSFESTKKGGFKIQFEVGYED
jgi:hypothetical protein